MAEISPVCDFGWPAVDATLPGVDGKAAFDIRSGRPNGLVVAFICNHCPYVKAVIERIVRDANGSEGGRRRLCRDQFERCREPIRKNSFDNMKLFAEAHGFAFPYLYDEDQTVAAHLWRRLHAGFLRLQQRLKLAVSRPARCLAQARPAWPTCAATSTKP